MMYSTLTLKFDAMLKEVLHFEVKSYLSQTSKVRLNKVSNEMLRRQLNTLSALIKEYNNVVDILLVNSDQKLVNKLKCHRDGSEG